MNFEEVNGITLNERDTQTRYAELATDALDLPDARFRKTVKEPFADTLSVDDSDRVKELAVTATATLTLIDLRNRLTIKALDDALTFFDEFIKSVVLGGGGGSIVTQVIGETVIVSDGVVEWVYRRRDLSDALTLIDNSASWRNIAKQLSESITITDGVVSWRNLGRQSSEQITVFDELITWRRRVVLSTDVLTLVDQLIAFAGRITTLLATETITVSDSGRTLEWAVTAEGALTIIDSFVKSVINGGGGITTRVVGENLVISSGLVEWVLRRRDVSEVLELTTEDSGLFQETATEDALVMFDQFIKTVVRPGGLSTVVVGDNLLVSDDAGNHWSYRRRDLSDTLSIVDQVSQYRLRGRVVDDPIVLQDQLVFWRRLVRVSSEVATLVDGLVTSILGFGTTYTRIVSESFTVQDSSGRYVFRSSTATDTIGLTDQQILWLQRIRSLAESVEVSDGTVLIKILRHIVSELLDIPDSVVSRYIPVVVFDVRIIIGAGMLPVLAAIDEIRLWFGFEPINLGAYN